MIRVKNPYLSRPTNFASHGRPPLSTEDDINSRIYGLLDENFHMVQDYRNRDFRRSISCIWRLSDWWSSIKRKMQAIEGARAPVEVNWPLLSDLPPLLNDKMEAFALQLRMFQVTGYVASPHQIQQMDVLFRDYTHALNIQIETEEGHGRLFETATNVYGRAPGYN